MRVCRPASTPGTAETVIGDPQAPSAPARAADKEWPSRRQPRGINRVPTHTVGRAKERRAYVRARLALPHGHTLAAPWHDPPYASVCPCPPRTAASPGTYRGTAPHAALLSAD